MTLQIAIGDFHVGSHAVPMGYKPTGQRAASPKRTAGTRDLAGIDGRKLARLIKAHAVAGRVVIEHGGTDTCGAPWCRTSVIAATVTAVRDQQDYNAWVRLVLDPQRADFESAADRQRIELSLEGVGFAPAGTWQRIFAANTWGFAGG